MAGKRHLFHSAIQSVLEGEATVRRYLKKLGLSLWLWLFLGGLLLTSTAVPALSQTGLFLGDQGNKDVPVVREMQLSKNLDSTAEANTLDAGRELLEQGQRQLQQGQISSALESWKAAEQHFRQQGNNSGILHSQLFQTEALRKLGFYPQACQVLVQIMETGDIPEISRSRSICQNQENVEELFHSYLVEASKDQHEAEPKKRVEANRRFKVATLRSLGVVLRGLGRLPESEMVLSNELGANDPATLLSLGNTLRAQGNLVRDRITSPNYDAMPWRFEKLDVLADEESNDIRDAFEEVDLFYRNADAQYKRVIELSGSLDQSISQKAQMNRLDIALELAHLFDSDTDKNWEHSANELANSVDINQLPIGQEHIFASLNLAKRLTFLNHNAGPNANWERIKTLLDTAEVEAKTLNNVYLESYVLGSRGGLYEYFAWLEEKRNNLAQAQQWREQAVSLAEEALKLTQPADAPEIAYQWQWQLGRLSKAALDKLEANVSAEERVAKRKVAIGYYEDSIRTLESIRSNLLSVNSDVQFSFRDNVEPIYRELVDLRLPVDRLKNSLGKSNDSLEETADYLRARELINELQLAELENFLQCNWQSQERKSLDELTLEEDSNAISIYPIILKDRLEILVSVPEQPSIASKSKNSQKKATIKRLAPTPINASSFEKEINRFRHQTIQYDPFSLEMVNNWRNTSKAFYRLLIKPIENGININPNSEQTLVFVMDGALRNLPLAALYNDQGQYLVENYSAALSVGLELPSSSDKANIRALLASQSQEIPDLNLSELSAVKKEIDSIASILNNLEAASFDFLPEEELSKDILIKSLKSKAYNIVHLAVHGQFSSDPQATFVVLSQTDTVTLNEIDDIFQTSSKDPVELLVLSACQTSNGDRRALLGLAGLTIQTGVRSSLGSLWSVDDEASSDLMTFFYQELAKNSNISQALRDAQLDLLKRSVSDEVNPAIWAPYILVGNWQSL